MSSDVDSMTLRQVGQKALPVFLSSPWQYVIDDNHVDERDNNS